MSELVDRMKYDASLMEDALTAALDMTDSRYPVLFDAMRYGVLGAGKRVRPFLVLEFARLFGAEESACLPFACAIECIHSYSLIHDDLPCMDNDDLRRGKPTNHKKFGEANALLAGDALLTYAFELAASNEHVKQEYSLRAVKLLAGMAGPKGMVGGQQIDLLSENQQIDFETLKYLHSKKTGCLIRCAALLGCLAAGEKCSDDMYNDADRYASGIGLAFQIIDDILDKTGDEKIFGKPIGSDEAQHKTTFLSFMSVDDAAARAKEFTENAKKAISGYKNSEILCDFADYLLTRNK